MMIEYTDMRERVAAGVALLDEHFADWRERINADMLTMNSPCKCVLGQLASMYSTGLMVVELDYDEAWQYGFDLTDEEYDKVNSVGVAYAWAELDILWLDNVQGVK